MSVIRTCLSLFGGDTVIVRCDNTFEIQMVSCNKTINAENRTATPDSINISAENEIYLTVPYTGNWDLIIKAKNDAPEHSISYFPA
ncbi:hypothetical protein [Brenneria rubrifaciens]|uniref:DUF1883 domain-containing protein n=1 Tax=Brenneria rubrifaciens TaxID=55213 RepID=A0A4P8QP42_9GAMM|nr:hypothetical protein [Brenneria rubrifaciens]QCR08751.1 hypothetical protein EH207_09520 [Brenneria rubrifaciens]